MQPKVQLFNLLLIALSLSGWLMWLGERNRGNSKSDSAAFTALELQAQELRNELDQLQEELKKSKQGSRGEIAIPETVIEVLETAWPDHPAFPDLVFADDPTLFASNLEQAQSLIPESSFTRLLWRCGLIEDRKSFLKQLALSRSEGSRAVAAPDRILLVENFDPDSIPDQAELLGAIELFWLKQRNPNSFEGNLALEWELKLRACAQLEKTNFLLRFARRGDALLPADNSSVTPIEELPLAIRACIHWQAQQQLKIDTTLKKALKNGTPTPPVSPRQGLGLIFTPFLLNPTSEEAFSGQITAETLEVKSDNRLLWTLTLSKADEAQAAAHALSLYFSDWPDAFGAAPSISQKNRNVNLSF